MSGRYPTIKGVMHVYYSGTSTLAEAPGSFIETIDLLADISSEILIEHFHTSVRVDYKTDNSPVTIADRAAENAMRKLIMYRHPAHGILGEEFGVYHSGAEYQWVLDPIDGTKSYISGVPLFGTLIALCHHGIPQLGCANFPLLGLRYFSDGRHTTINGLETRMRSAASIDEATLLVTDHTDIWHHKNGPAFDALAARVKLFRSWGDCYGYALLASGSADIMVDPILESWDMLALIPIVIGAGGVVSSYEGGDPLASNSLVAAHPSLHASVIEALNCKSPPTK